MSVTRIAGGRWNGSTWTDEFLGFSAIGGSNQVWVQYQGDSTQLVTAATTTFLPLFTETATLTIELAIHQTVVQNYSQTRPPNTTSYLLTSLYSASVALSSGVETAPIPFSLHTATGASEPIFAALHSGDRFGLRFTWSGTGGSIAPLAISTTEQPRFTGLADQWRAQGRADECPRCGQKSTRDTWVRDGYTKTMVCPSCWDPEDPLIHPATPRPEHPGLGEG